MMREFTEERDWKRFADAIAVRINSTFDVRFLNKRSELHGPPPMLARNRKMQQ